jgi:hypothetical protein
MKVAVEQFFGAIREIASLIPDFGEERKKEIDKLTEDLFFKKQVLKNYAVSFNDDSNPDVLMGLADAVKKSENLLQEKYIIYSKELRG